MLELDLCATAKIFSDKRIECCLLAAGSEIWMFVLRRYFNSVSPDTGISSPALTGTNGDLSWRRALERLSGSEIEFGCEVTRKANAIDRARLAKDTELFAD